MTKVTNGNGKRSSSTRQAKSGRRKAIVATRRPPTPLKVNGAKPALLPRCIDVKLATLVKSAPEGDNWFHEIKFDGYRMVCRIENGRVEFFSRNRKSWTTNLSYLVSAGTGLPVKQAILDGEVVAFKSCGTTDFQALQNVFSDGRQDQLVYYVFDLLHLNGMDLRNATLEDRKKRLDQIVPMAMQDGPIRFSEHVVGDGPEFFKRASKLGLEGIISKLRNSTYTAGRSHDWLKVKASQREEFVIGGFTDPGIREGFGALLLGYYDKNGDLLYAGKVGTGFTDRVLEALRQRLDRLAKPESPFKDLQKTTGEARGAHWVKPQLVGQVAFTEWTRGGHLRHPSFLGLREDKPAHTVVRDRALAISKLTKAGSSSHLNASRINGRSR